MENFKTRYNSLPCENLLDKREVLAAFQNSGLVIDFYNEHMADPLVKSGNAWRGQVSASRRRRLELCGQRIRWDLVLPFNLPGRRRRVRVSRQAVRRQISRRREDGLGVYLLLLSSRRRTSKTGSSVIVQPADRRFACPKAARGASRIARLALLASRASRHIAGYDYFAENRAALRNRKRSCRTDLLSGFRCGWQGCKHPDASLCLPRRPYG